MTEQTRMDFTETPFWVDGRVPSELVEAVRQAYNVGYSRGYSNGRDDLWDALAATAAKAKG